MNGFRLKYPPKDSDHRRGDLEAPIILVEYGDFECPYCASAVQKIENLIRYFGSEMCFIYRHFPIIKIHPNAGVAAVASEAADLQGKFWEMHHILFENYQNLEGDKLLYLARDLKLDLRLFSNDMEFEKLATRVQQDVSEGLNNGIVSTPAFFLNEILLKAIPTVEEIAIKLKDAPLLKHQQKSPQDEHPTRLDFH